MFPVWERTWGVWKKTCEVLAFHIHRGLRPLDHAEMPKIFQHVAEKVILGRGMQGKASQFVCQIYREIHQN